MHALCRGASRPRLSSELVTSSQNVKPQNINFSQYSHLFSSKTIPQLLRSPTLQYPLFSSKSSCLPQRRSVADFAVMSPLALKIIVGSSIAASYVGYLSFLRANFKQRQYILKRLRIPCQLILPPIALVRENEQKILHKFLNSPPSGPSVIIGPEAAGKSALLKRVLSGRKMTLWIDLKQNPVTTGEEFLVSFITTSGYLLPQQNNLWASFLGLTRGGRRDEVHTGQEFDAALSAFSDVLRQQRESGWPEGIPIIVLDDIHRLGTCNDLELANTKVSDDPNFLKFMDWVVHVSDNKLAHILFITSYSFAHHSLDTHAAFRRHRSHISIDYSEPAQVKHYLQSLFAGRTDVKLLSEEAIDNIVGCVGGQVEDLDKVITGLVRGDAYYNILRSMLTDSILEIENHIENILEKASRTENDDEKLRIYQKYMRFWALMELLHKERYVNKRSVVVTIFQHQHTEELEELLAVNIISFVNERFPDPIGKKPDSIFSLLNSSLDSIAFTAGSPKLRMAFGLLLKDDRMLKQKQWVMEQIEMRDLKDKHKETLSTRKFLLDEHNNHWSKLEKMIDKEDKWIAVLGKDEFDRQKNHILTEDRELVKGLLTENQKLEKLRQEISAKM